MLCTLVACFKNFGGYACSDLAPVSTCFSFYGGQYVLLFLGETVRHGHFNNYTLDIAETMGNTRLLLLFSLFFASLCLDLGTVCLRVMTANYLPPSMQASGRAVMQETESI